MNGENKDVGNERREDAGQRTDNQVSLNISHPQFIQFLQSLEQSAQEYRNREVNERFKNVSCFKRILGSSKTFKLEFSRPFVGKSLPTVWPEGWGTKSIKIWPHSARNTWSMSFLSKNELAFLSYVYHPNDVTVFSPDIQQPIGRIVKNDGLHLADIFSLATDSKFIMKKSERTSDAPAIMHIEDPQTGKVLAIGSVSKWETIRKYTTTKYLREFSFQMRDDLSEPSRIMLFVSFVISAKWAKEESSRQNMKHKFVFFIILVAILLFIFLLKSSLA